MSFDYFNNVDFKIEEAADSLLRADMCLFVVGRLHPRKYLDGIPYYDDIPRYKRKDYSRSFFLDPGLMQRDPAMFFGFWGHVYNQHFRDTACVPTFSILINWCRNLWPEASDRWEPKEGAVLTPEQKTSAKEKFIDRQRRSLLFKRNYMNFIQRDMLRSAGMFMPSSSHTFPSSPAGPFFVITSCFDRDLERSGFEHVYHALGETRWWQCSKPCRSMIWTMEKDRAFNVDLKEMEAPEKMMHENNVDVSKKKKKKTTKTKNEARDGDEDNSNDDDDNDDGELEKESNWPRCSRCKRISRPNVRLGPHDEAWIAPQDAWKAYQNWKATALWMAKKTDFKLVILEIGTATDDVVLRSESEYLLSRSSTDQSHLLRITHDDSSTPILKGSTTCISISAGDGVQKMDEYFKSKLFL